MTYRKQIIKTLACTAMLAAGAQQMQAQSKLYPQHFDLSEVRITAGPFRDAMVTNARMLLDYDADRLMTPFVREAKIDRPGNKYNGWVKAHPSFPNWGDYSWSLEGHVGGHYITALALGYNAMKDDKELQSLALQMKERMDYCLGIMKDCQDAYKGNTEGMEGFIGGQPYTEMWTGLYKGDLAAFRKFGGMVPFYCQHKVMAGLRDAYVYGESELAKQMLSDFTMWIDRLVEKMDHDQMQQILGWEHGGINETIADAAYLLGERKYMATAAKFSHMAMVDGMKDRADGTYDEHFLDRKHANTQVPKYIGFARIAQVAESYLTPKEKSNFPKEKVEFRNTFGSAVSNFWDDVATHRTVCIGGNSVGEHFLPADNCSPYMTNLEGPESCNTNNMLKLSEMLFDNTHDAKYADFYESAMWNHILSTQDPLTGGYVYFTTLRPQGYRIYSQVNEGMWCCVGTGMENHSKYAHFTYTHISDTLFVNQFMPTELKSKAFGLKQETGFPYEQGTTLTITKAGKYTLAIRKPSWVGDGYAVKVNGKDAGTLGKNDYTSVTRSWKVGDVVEVNLPMELSVEELPNYTDYVAFKVGPVLLAARTTAQNESEAHLTHLKYEHLQNEYGDDSRMGHSPGARGTRKSLNEAPMFIGERSTLLNRIKPKLPARHIYTIQPDEVGQSKWPELTLEPFYGIHHARYSCYWYAQTPEEYAKSPMVQAEQAAAALEARTIDYVATGEQQSEAGHLMKISDGCRKGSFNSEAYREIPNGQEVSYTFTNARAINKAGAAEASIDLPKDNVVLMMRVTRHDQRRVFNIYIDDKPLVENYVTPGKHPSLDENQFMNLEFPIPAEMLVDAKGNAKKTLTFRMKANNDGMAPSIFYLRLIDK